MSIRIENSSVNPPLLSIPVHTASVTKTQTLYERCVLSPIRSLMRQLFLPLFNKLPSKYEVQMKKEEQFFQNFWDPNAPLYPELSHHKKIKETFSAQNREFSITVKGQPCKVQCFVIEPKNKVSEQSYCNIAHVLGINSTLNNTIMHTYPLLAAYVDVKEKPSARFIIINHYSISRSDGSIFKPETLSEAGLILSETLKAIEESYGTIHQLLSYSLGSIVTAAALKYFHKHFPENTTSLAGRITFKKSLDETDVKTSRVFKSLPQNIIFDRGPSSIEKLSNRYTRGSILLPLARLSGWDINIGKEISSFIQNCKERAPNITIINALQDHRFYGDVNLCASPEIVKLAEKKKVTSILLDICVQSINETAQHSFSLGNWYGSHLVEGYKKQNFLQRDQSLASAIIQQSFSAR